MTIKIKSIEAEITDLSTFEESDFKINRWVIKYEIVIEHNHVIQGRLNWSAVPDAYKIIKFITWFYGKRNTNTSQQ
jgi:hypothetical protein